MTRHFGFLLLVAMLFQVPALQAQQANKNKYGNNIISFSPIDIMPTNNIGIGLSYERLVSDHFGVCVPVMIGLSNNYTNVGLELKVYPTNNKGAARYAIAPMIMYGDGSEKSTRYIFNSNLGYSEMVNVYTRRQHFGFLLNQTVNFTIMNQFFLGLDGGLGVNYYDKRINVDGVKEGITFAAQFRVAMGYRF